MKKQKHEKKEISPLALTLIAGGFVIAGALITVLFPYFFNKQPEIYPESSYSDEGESETNDSSSNYETSDYTEDSEQNKRSLFYADNGRVELFNDHSGIAYIYKNYLDEYPIGLINEYGNFKIIGWSIEFTFHNKSFFICIDSSQNNDEDNNLYCIAQYDINGEPQIDNFNHPNAKYGTNGDLEIEFNFDTVPFDLRDSSPYIKIDEIIKGI